MTQNGHLMTQSKQSPLRIGLFGLGTVGQSVIDLIEKNNHLYEQRTGRALEIVGVSARSRLRARRVDITQYQWYDNPIELAESDHVDVMVEVVGGTTISKSIAQTTLLQGKSWVTANKALLAEQGAELVNLARDKGASIGFEAAVCGAIPIIKTLREALISGNVRAIQGILNGTSNYILSEMSQGGNFETVLKIAQEKGYAEADPTLDIGGGDAAHKAALMGSLISGKWVDFAAVHIEGIDKIPSGLSEQLAQYGLKLKLIGQCYQTDEGLAVWVYPAAVHTEHVLSQISNVTNAVYYSSDVAGIGTQLGAGAGGDATASAVLADILDIAASRSSVGGGLHARQGAHMLPIDERVGDYWIMQSQPQDLRSALADISSHVQLENQGMLLGGVKEKNLRQVLSQYDQKIDWVRVEKVQQ